MKRKIEFIHGAFAFSLVAHVFAFIFLQRPHKTSSTPAPRYQTVSLHIRGDVETSSATTLQERKGRKTKAHLAQLTDVVLSQTEEAEESETSAPATSAQSTLETPADSVASEHSSTTQASGLNVGVDSVQLTESVKNLVHGSTNQVGFTAPCQHISMPVQWTQLRNVWPRKYTVELQPREDAQGMALTVVQMQPVAEAIPLLDRRVQSAFVDCLSNQKNIPVRLAGALNPLPAEAYSAEIEFFPDNPNVASQ